jgi:hypothetical protein
LTTEQGVLALAEVSPLLGFCELHDEPNQGRSIQCANAVLIVDRASGIILQIGFEAPAFTTVADVVGQYGEPLYVDVGVIGTPETPHTGMSLYFDAIHTSLALEEQEGVGYAVSPSTPVSGIWYGPTPEFPGWKLPWHGYGQYRLSPPGLPNNSLKLTRRAGA